MLCRFAGAMSRCGAANQIQHYPRQPAKHLDLQAPERKANQLADLRIDDTHTALSSTVAGRWRWDLIARDEFRPSVLRLLRTQRGVLIPVLYDSTSLQSFGARFASSGPWCKSPDSIILIRPLLLRPFKGVQYPRSNFPMDHLTSPSGTL